MLRFWWFILFKTKLPFDDKFPNESDARGISNALLLPVLSSIFLNENLFFAKSNPTSKDRIRALVKTFDQDRCKFLRKDV